MVAAMASGPMGILGRVPPLWLLSDAYGERPLVAEWSRPVFGTARHEAASEDQVLSVSKVASNSSGGVPGIGQLRSIVNVSKQAARPAHLVDQQNNCALGAAYRRYRPAYLWQFCLGRR